MHEQLQRIRHLLLDRPLEGTLIHLDIRLHPRVTQCHFHIRFVGQWKIQIQIQRRLNPDLKLFRTQCFVKA